MPPPAPQRLLTLVALFGHRARARGWGAVVTSALVASFVILDSRLAIRDSKRWLRAGGDRSGGEVLSDKCVAVPPRLQPSANLSLAPRPASACAPPPDAALNALRWDVVVKNRSAWMRR